MTKSADMNQHSDSSQAPEVPKRRTYRWLNRLIIVLAVLIALPLVGGLIVDVYPQSLIGLFQGYQNQNSFEPRNGATPGTATKANGEVYMNDICYGDEYPNSFLDITYPDGDMEKERPTFLYIHGGGFFGGDKATGDPLAVNSDSNYLFDSIVEQGYNLVNMNYALVPQYRFPVPELQLNQALAFLVKHADEYHLDMNNLIIMGQSGGAVMTAQYGAIVSNPEYAALYGITPAIELSSIRCLVIDDAPLIFDHFDRNGKRLLGNYISGNSFPSEEQKAMYDPIGYVTSQYPRSFIIGNNYRGNGYAYDMEQLYDALEAHKVPCEYFYGTYPDGTEPNHGYLSNLKNDELAQKCFKAMMHFIKDE